MSVEFHMWRLLSAPRYFCYLEASKQYQSSLYPRGCDLNRRPWDFWIFLPSFSMKRIPFIEDVLVLLNSSLQKNTQLLFLGLVEVVEVPDIVLDQAKNISTFWSRIDLLLIRHLKQNLLQTVGTSWLRGSILSSHPAAPSLVQCYWDLSATVLRRKWTEAWNEVKLIY